MALVVVVGRERGKVKVTPAVPGDRLRRTGSWMSAVEGSCRKELTGLPVQAKQTLQVGCTMSFKGTSVVDDLEVKERRSRGREWWLAMTVLKVRKP